MFSKQFICNNFFKLLAVFFVLIAIARIHHSYKSNTLVSDELHHLATGFEWLENHTYYMEALHPPLSRIIISLLLYLQGERLGKDFYKSYALKGNTFPVLYQNSLGRVKAGQSLIFSNGASESFDRTALIRLANLPFFILGALFLFLLTKQIFISEAIAACSVFFYTTLPIILASAGLATTDMACVFSLILASYYGILWLEKPNFIHSVALGIATATIAISKFSGIYFFTCYAAAAIIAKDLSEKKLSRGYSKVWLQSVAIVFVINFIIVWSTYRFSISSINDPDNIFIGEWHDLVNLVSTISVSVANKIQNIGKYIYIPASQFWNGISELPIRNSLKFAGYIFDQVLEYKGVIYFFPVATLFKTPISFLILSLIGIIYQLKSFGEERNWKKLFPLLAISLTYLACTLFNINIGLRHILPVFPLLSIYAAYAIVKVSRSLDFKEKLYRKQQLITSALVITYLFSSFSSHPHYISYFNFMAGDKPENILIDQDLDIGQELFLIIEQLKNREIINDTIIHSAGGFPPQFLGAKLGSYGCFNFGHFQELIKINNHYKYKAIGISAYKIGKYYFTEKLPKCKVIPEKLGNTFYLFEGELCDF